MEVEDLHRLPCRSGVSVAGGSLTREVSVRARAAATKPGRSSTARWIGFGERDAEVYVRNRRLRPVMSHRPEIWRIWAGCSAHLFLHRGAGNFWAGLCLQAREATVNACGVAVAMLPGQSRAPTATNGQQ